MTRSFHWTVIALMFAGACTRPFPGGLETGRPFPSGAGAIETGSVEGEIISSGVSRHYILHVPPGYLAGFPLPLLLNFHGYGSNSTQEEALSGQQTDGRPDPRPMVREDLPQLGDLLKEFDFSQQPLSPLMLPIHPAPGPASIPGSQQKAAPPSP